MGTAGHGFNQLGTWLKPGRSELVASIEIGLGLKNSCRCWNSTH